MVEVKRIKLQDQSFLGIYLNLPQYPIHLLVSTHAILAQDIFSLQQFHDEHKQVAVVLCEYLYGFDGILGSCVKGANEVAIHMGVKVGMNAKEALILCESNKEKEGKKD